MRIVLETTRLVLREMVDSDLDFVAAMLGDPQVMRFYPRPLSRPEAQEWLERQVHRYTEHGHGLWLVLEKASGEPVGQAGLITQRVEGRLEPEIGYLLHAPFWHRGFATESGLAIRDHAFAALGHPHVVSLIHPENLASRAVASRLGMKPLRDVLFHGLRHLMFFVSRD